MTLLFAFISLTCALTVIGRRTTHPRVRAATVAASVGFLVAAALTLGGLLFEPLPTWGYSLVITFVVLREYRRAEVRA